MASLSRLLETNMNRSAICARHSSTTGSVLMLRLNCLTRSLMAHLLDQPRGGARRQYPLDEGLVRVLRSGAQVSHGCGPAALGDFGVDQFNPAVGILIDLSENGGAQDPQLGL